VPAGATGYVAGDPVRVVLSWQPSTDDASAVTYRVSRNGNFLAPAAETTFTDMAITAGQSYTYVVRAVDSAGNLSDPSAAVTVVAPPAATSRLRG
jgi:chitin-binding protein